MEVNNIRHNLEKIKEQPFQKFLVLYPIQYIDCDIKNIIVKKIIVIMAVNFLTGKNIY